MSVLNTLQTLVAEAVESGLMKDMTEATKGGARLLPEGYAFGRLVEYIELGAQPQEFNGVAKAPAPEARLAFALWGEGYQEDDGSPYVLRMWDMALGTNEKSKAFKLFKKLNYKGTAKSFAQLLNEAFLIKIMHTKPKKAGDAPRSVIDLEGFLPPFDPVTKQPYAIPAASDELFKLFLWERPTKECWDSLYIDGTNETTGKSKNFIQNKCLSAKNFPGSPLEAMLMGLGMPTLAADCDNPDADSHEEPTGTQAQEATPAAVPAIPAATPAVPTAPVDDAPPFTPDAPAAPVVPTTPAAQVVPAAPVVPATPVVPTVPVVPVVPNIPAVPTLPKV